MIQDPEIARLRTESRLAYARSRRAAKISMILAVVSITLSLTSLWMGLR